MNQNYCPEILIMALAWKNEFNPPNPVDIARARKQENDE
jgi:hypothetical protein